MTNAPNFYAYSVKDRTGKKAVWTRIGAAWSHAQGGGFNIRAAGPAYGWPDRSDAAEGRAVRRIRQSGCVIG